MHHSLYFVVCLFHHPLLSYFIVAIKMCSSRISVSTNTWFFFPNRISIPIHHTAKNMTLMGFNSVIVKNPLCPQWCPLNYILTLYLFCAHVLIFLFLFLQWWLKNSVHLILIKIQAQLYFQLIPSCFHKAFTEEAILIFKTND